MFLRNALALILLLVSSSAAFAHSESSVPEGLSSSDWASIRAQIQARQFQAQAAADGSYTATNPAHGFQVRYRPDGTTVLRPSHATDKQADYRIALQLQGYGYGDALIGLDNPPILSANGQTLTYQWQAGLREWWVNSERGVEQWFELAQPLALEANGAPLTLSMHLTTGLRASIHNNALHLRSDDGLTDIRYQRLKVWDASGRLLPSEMVLAGHQLALQVDDHQAIYPLTIDPTFVQQAYLKASNTEVWDRFGYSVAVDGDTVVVGSPEEDSNATGVDGDHSDNSASSAGAAYVFVRSGGTWSQQAYLKASNTNAGDWFGESVAVNGDTVVVGAPEEDSNATGVDGDQSDNSAIEAGAAYVFVRSGGIWSQQAYLKASNTEAEDRFGTSVALDGDTVVVGAYGEDSSVTGVDGDETDNSASLAGAVYAFVRSGGTWSQQAYLKASNTDSGDQFGRSVAVNGDAVVVGAWLEASNATGVDSNQSDNSATYAGAAYVFVRSGGTWSQQAYLKASNTDASDQFGTSVALGGDTVVVGATGEDSNATGVDGDQGNNSASVAGAAYVFVRSGGTWSQQAYLKASNTEAWDRFGTSVALDGDTVVVGATGEDSSVTGVDGDDSDNSASDAGAAYVFVRSGVTWSQQAYLKASNTGVGDYFGASVALGGDTVLVGAWLEDSSDTGVDGDDSDNSASAAGAAYVFNLAGASVIFSDRFEG